MKNMSNVRQDRVPDPTHSHASAPLPEGGTVNGRGTAPRTIVLSLRLRTQDSSGYLADVSWAGDVPAAALAVDVLSASGGTLDPLQGGVLPARFVNLQSALLALRRLQWGLQGLAESPGSAAVVASMAVHSDGAMGIAGPILDRLGPGQLVAEASLVDGVLSLPGAAARETGDGRWREIQWRSGETATGFSADEQSVLGLIRAMGREDPSPAAVEAPRPMTVTAAAPVTGAFRVSESLSRSSLGPEPASGLAKFKWLIVGGAAAVVVLVALLVVPGMVSGNHGKVPVQSPDASSKQAAPAAPAPVPTPVPVVEKPLVVKQPAKPAKQQPKTDTQVQKAPVVTGHCDLTEAEIPRSLNRAEQYMYAGKLEDAQAMYERVLPCPTAHDKAQEGLQRVKQRMAAQSP